MGEERDMKQDQQVYGMDRLNFVLDSSIEY